MIMQIITGRKKELGFKFIEIKPKNMYFIFLNIQEFSDWQRPAFMSAPLAALISHEALENLLAELVQKIWAMLEVNPDGSRIFSPTTTVVRAQKPFVDG